MIKVLYLIHKVELPVHEHVIAYLKANGILVDLELLGPAPKDMPRKNVWTKLQDSEFIDELKNKNYNFVVSNTHSKYLSKLYKALKKQTIFIDIEHDLLSNEPEHFLKSTVFTVQDKHTDYCRENDIPFVRCQWPKLDLQVSPCDVEINPWTEAVLIGTTAFNEAIEKKKPFMKRGFHKIWYKKYASDWDQFKNTEELPSCFIGPVGIKHCADNFNFLLTQKSSCFVEFLLLGRTPIIIGDYEVKEELNDFISIVSLAGEDWTFRAMTGVNIQKKINRLREDYSLYKEIRQTLLNDWIHKDYYELPSFKEALYKFVKENK